MSDDRHLLRLAGMPIDRLRSLLSEANRVADGGSPPGLSGRSIANLFFEDSTRTRTSFALAAARLGLSVVDLSDAGSSRSKGESYVDTARTVAAMGVEALVVRSSRSGTPALLASAMHGSGAGAAIINAGDGRHEHPTQGLLDVLAIARAHGRADGFDLSGLTVAIVGDCAHSRVARSDVAAMTALGARVVLCGPPAMVSPALARALGCEHSANFDAVLREADAVQMLRVQFERGARVASARQYRAGYALTAERARAMRAGSVVMHPGPMNRGLEIDGEVADSDGSGGLPRSLVLEQVRLGVAVRVTVLAGAFRPVGGSGGGGGTGRAMRSPVAVGAS